jgi:hypothetical protein
MRNFVIFFEEKEGTSPLVRLLNNFDQISIVHQVDNRGWEPFDVHNCGPMPLRRLGRCLNLIFDKKPVDMKQLNRIYTRTSTRPLDDIHKNGAVGFKMRFTPPKQSPLEIEGFLWLGNVLQGLLKKYYYHLFKQMMIRLLRLHDVTVFLAVRQDVLRWGLSKYHGDGTGKPGHLQFKLASGELRREEIGKIRVDCSRLGTIISKCYESYANKRRFMEELCQEGIKTYALLYEEFISNSRKYMHRICDILEIDVSNGAIDGALRQGAYFKKVHSDDISDFVLNHEEVLEKFGNRFFSWI